jgi:hypothetical protein
MERRERMKLTRSISGGLVRYEEIDFGDVTGDDGCWNGDTSGVGIFNPSNS